MARSRNTVDSTSLAFPAAIASAELVSPSAVKNASLVLPAEAVDQAAAPAPAAVLWAVQVVAARLALLSLATPALMRTLSLSLISTFPLL